MESDDDDDDDEEDEVIFFSAASRRQTTPARSALNTVAMGSDSSAAKTFKGLPVEVCGPILFC